MQTPAMLFCPGGNFGSADYSIQVLFVENGLLAIYRLVEREDFMMNRDPMFP